MSEVPILLKPETRPKHERQYSSTWGAIFNDTRDAIAKKLLALGGSKALVEQSLKNESSRYSRRPKLLKSSSSKSLTNNLNGNIADVVDESVTPGQKKVTIVGTGNVGLAIAYSIINQGTASYIALIDHPMAADKLEGEVEDLQQGSAYNRRVRIEGSTTYDITKDSNFVAITAGLARKPGETRLQLVEKNVGIMRSIITEVLKYSPKAVICVVSNPCDIMAAVATKVASELKDCSIAPGQIFGSGTVLDSGRFKTLLAASVNCAPKSVHAHIIGEHGDSCVPLWSCVNVGGVRLLKKGQSPSEIHKAVHQEVVNSGAKVIKKKGYTCWAIGVSVAHIADVVLSDERRVMTVSTCVRGIEGVEEDVFLSLPCVVGAKGIYQVMDLEMSMEEAELFRQSAQAVWEVQKGIWDSI